MDAAISHFLQFADFSRDELEWVLERSRVIKDRFKRYEFYQPLADRTLAMVFEKASTRTRVSFEAGMYQMGGSVIHITTGDSQLGRAEPIEDTARVISRMVDVVMIRTYGQSKIERFAEYSRVPVINGLTNEYHPCQILADIFTFIEHRGPIAGRTVAWIGDANNMAYTWLQAARVLGFHVNVSTPPTYGARRRPGAARPALHGVRRPDGCRARRAPGHHRRLDQHGLRVGERSARGGLRRLAGRRGHDAGRHPRGGVHALPARAPRARRSRPKSSTGRSPSSGTRPKTACTSRRR